MTYITFYCDVLISFDDNVLRINHNLKIITHNLGNHVTVSVNLFKCSRSVLAKQSFCAGAVIYFGDMARLRFKNMIVRVDARDIRVCVGINSFWLRFFPIVSFILCSLIRDTCKIWFGCKWNTSNRTFFLIKRGIAVISS